MLLFGAANAAPNEGQWFYPANWESTCTFENGKIAHAKCISASIEDRGSVGVLGASPRNILKSRMQESAS